jgi:hypothetical protein
VRLLWTVGPITVLDLTLLETTEAPEQGEPDQVHDLSTQHERGEPAQLGFFPDRGYDDEENRRGQKG